MAVKTFCDDIVAVYTNCESVAAIYTYCEQVWPTSSTIGAWYVKWRPTDLSGHFYMDNIERNLEDYSGIYRWNGVGEVTWNAFEYTGMTWMKTNVLSIDRFGFSSCSSLQSISLPRCQYLGYGAFDRCGSLQGTSCVIVLDDIWELYLPVCEYIGNYAFYANNLNVVRAPVCSYIGDGAFYYQNITHIMLPECKYVGSSAFRSCSYLGDRYGTSIINSHFDLPKCEYIGSYAFYGCQRLSKIGTIRLPECEYIGSSAFYGTQINGIYLPKCSYIGDYAFYDINAGYYGAINNIELPECEYIGSSAFINNNDLLYAILYKCSFIGNSAFSYCASFRYIALGSNSVCSLGDLGAIPFRSVIEVFVPQPLINDYKTAMYWSNFSSRIFPLGYYGQFNVKWTPANANGTLNIAGYNYDINSFNGSYSFDIPIITNSAFQSTDITSVSGNMMYVSECAFKDCVSLVSVSFPNCTVVDYSAFQNCTSLKNLYLPMCDDIASCGFMSCTDLSNIDFPSCTLIEESVFKGCTSLQYVNLQKCTRIWTGAFENCTALRSISIPKCYIISEKAFLNCFSLSSISLPVISDIHSSAFKGCTSLQYVYMSGGDSIEKDAFYGCTSLSMFVLNENGLPAPILFDSYVFYGTSFWNGQGIIYVQTGLYSDLVSASGWSYYSSLMVPFSGTGSIPTL